MQKHLSESNNSNISKISFEDNCICVDKNLIIDKFIEANILARKNIESGNITNRGIAANVCTFDNVWSLGTNFNNTRNDISSLCAERSAILSSYNNFLLNRNSSSTFKIKYLVLVSSLSFNQKEPLLVPCEDCLCWFNNSRYFDSKTTIFTLDKTGDIPLIKTFRVEQLLPYFKIKTTNEYSKKKNIEITKKALESMKEFAITESDIKGLFNEAYLSYKNNDLCPVSNQKISCSVLANNHIFVSKKIDWTRRWFVEPLEMCVYKAVEKLGRETFIQAIAYFGDEYFGNNDLLNQDGVVSIRSIGRIRQKQANCKTILILNLKESIKVLTIGEYLPLKFRQGYNI